MKKSGEDANGGLSFPSQLKKVWSWLTQAPRKMGLHPKNQNIRSLLFPLLLFSVPYDGFSDYVLHYLD